MNDLVRAFVEFGPDLWKATTDTFLMVGVTMLAAVVLGLPLGVVLAFPAGLGGAGIWTGLAASLAVVAALMTWRWMQRERLGLMGRR